MDQNTPSKSKGAIFPLVVCALPFLLFDLYRWFVFDSFASAQIVTPRLEEEHRRVHLGVFFLLTFFPFAAICFFTSTVILICRARRSRVARWSLVFPATCLMAVLAVLFLVLSGH
jgi:hypothetical protein